MQSTKIDIFYNISGYVIYAIFMIDRFIDSFKYNSYILNFA